MENTQMRSTLVSFNCKAMKRSMEGIRTLCKAADVVALQETWLLPHDLPLLSTIDEDFGCTGTSAVDTSLGLLSGRPYGGVAILWRKSAFESVSVIDCNSARICAIKVMTQNGSVIIFSVYMPVNGIENLTVFTDCLSVIKSVIEVNTDSEAAYILGDFNAHPNELFCNELLSFCVEQDWCCVDMEMLGMQSSTYTFTSEAHGCRRWLDHCIVTKAAQETIHNVWVQHDVYWSDHSPLYVECNIDKIVVKCAIDNKPVCNGVSWGRRDVEQVELYQSLCHQELKELDFPMELSSCADTCCSDPAHTVLLDNMYTRITNILTQASMRSYGRACFRRGGYITGWNKYVADAHRRARLGFQLWVLAGRPSNGNVYKQMCDSRRVFKSKLKWCQSRQEQIKMDILASNHSEGNFSAFWKNTNKLNPRPSVPVSVGGISDPKSIANNFRDHFTVRSSLGPAMADTGGAGPVVSGRTTRFSAKEVVAAIRRMKGGKSPGYDGLSIEHFRHAGVHLPRVLAMFFTLCIGHSHLPQSLMKTVVVPVLKNRTGDVSDRSNYRPISLATTTAKILDGLLNQSLSGYLHLHDAQFGFRAGLSTESAILCLKHTVKYYTERKTPIYACFLDLSKAFDTVAYGMLWRKLEETGMPTEYTRILQFWYKNQTNQVRWVDTLSDEYTLECGVRQGGLTSTGLFSLYVNQLIEELSSTHVGCYIDGTCVNNISYADDMVLLAPSVNALRTLVDICERYANEHGLRYNTQKSEVLIFRAGKQRPSEVPPIMVDGTALKIVNTFKYLGHLVTEDLKDDADIERERRALAVRSNMLARRFARCTREVKITLFRAYCQSFYSSGLWVRYTQRAYNVLRVQYNNAFRMLLGLPRYCSASQMFADARVDGFHALMRKKAASLLQRLRGSTNSILQMIASRYDCPIQAHWVGIVTGKL